MNSRRHVLLCVACLSWSIAPRLALAHGVEDHPAGVAGPRDWHELWRTWGLEPGVLIPLIVTALFYARGLRKLWRGGHAGRGIGVAEALCFLGGWTALAIALVSPLHPWGSVLFSAHMTQHEVLMLVAAPLLVLGKPIIASLKALPPGWARRLIGWARGGWWHAMWVVLTNPLAAWLVHAAVLWAWHVPSLFEATLHNELVHALQHLSFLLSATLFWWAILQSRPRALGYGVGVLYLFTTAMHSGLLGAMITLSRSLWYRPYRETTASWGLTPLEDQQLGGLIMWVPACTLYVIAALVLCAGCLRESERGVLEREARSAGREPPVEQPSSAERA